jgi:flavin reductase (DIM6/NTAB) family NADH-FMN oxidoreductase RutF
VLDAAQKRIASLYADRFTAVHARFANETDAIIDGVAAYFVCTLVREHEGGDHRIVMGEIQRFAGSGEAAPLVYHGRSWHALALGSDQ